MSKLIFLRLVIILAFATLASCATGPKPNAERDEHQSTTAAVEEPEEARQTKLNAIDNTQLKEAVSLLRQGKKEIARNILLKLDNEAPKNTFVLSNLAAIAFSDNQQNKARELTVNALKLDSKNAHAHNIMALLEVESGNILLAEKSYISALKVDSNYADAHYNIALLYDIYYQDLEKAIKHYQAYLGLVQFSDAQTLEWVQELERSTGDQ